MLFRSGLWVAAFLLAGCAHKGGGPKDQPNPQKAQSASSGTHAPAQVDKHRELAVSFDPIFAKAPSEVNTDQGLRIEDYRSGEGEAVSVGSGLSLHFVGYLEDGTIFDQNPGPPMPPFRFDLPQKPRVAGWGLGLVGMRAGGIRKIVVPPELGYGEEGDPGDEDVPPIPPNSTLTYLVKMLEVTPPPPKPVADAAFQGEPLSQETRQKGLLVQEFKKGTGPAAKEGDGLVIYIRGYLPDGTLFSQRETPISPFRFALGDKLVLPGWNIGLVGMQVGGLRKLQVPPKLAYGSKAQGPIPANTTLTFTCQLIELVDGQASPTASVPSSPEKQ